LVPTSFKTSERIKVVLGGSSQLDKRVSKIPKERIPSEVQGCLKRIVGLVFA
jgi:hypothetical protein